MGNEANQNQKNFVERTLSFRGTAGWYVVAGLSTLLGLGGCKFANSDSSGGSSTPSTTVTTVVLEASTVASGSSIGVYLTPVDDTGSPILGDSFSVSFLAIGGTSTGTVSDAVYSDANGRYEASFTAAIAGTPTTIVGFLNGDLLDSTPPSVTVTAGSPSATMSTIIGAAPASANGLADGTVTVTLKDDSGNPVSGVTPTFTATDTGNTNVYGACSASLDTGVSTCTMKSLVPETKTLQILTPVAVTGGSIDFQNTSANLVIPIAMVDYSLSSSTGPLIFDRTATSLLQSAYDGTVTYTFEITAANTDVASHSVYLIDNLFNTVATITVPGSTATATRLTTTFTPAAGASVFKIKLDATTAANKMQVFAGRMIVQQVGGTKTRIYVPLVGYQESSYSNTDAGIGPDTTTATSYTQGTARRYALWNKGTNAYYELDPATPFTLEIVGRPSVATKTAYFSLFDATAGVQVTDSEIQITGTINNTLAQATFLDTATNFTDGHDFEVRIKSVTGSTAALCRAGLWITLSRAVWGEVPFRVSREGSYAASTWSEQSRVFLNATYFSNPSFYLETVGMNATAGGSKFILNEDSADVGTVTAAAITDGTVVMPTTKTRQRGSNALSIGNGVRYVGYHFRTAGTDTFSNAHIVTTFVAD